VVESLWRIRCLGRECWCFWIEPEKWVVVVGLRVILVGLRNEQRTFIVDICALLGFVIFTFLLFYYKSLSNGLCNTNTVDYGDKGPMISLAFNDAEREDLSVWRGRFWTASDTMLSKGRGS
jgi:hypothetical protein